MVHVNAPVGRFWSKKFHSACFVPRRPVSPSHTPRRSGQSSSSSSPPGISGKVTSLHMLKWFILIKACSFDVLHFIWHPRKQCGWNLWLIDWLKCKGADETSLSAWLVFCFCSRRLKNMPTHQRWWPNRKRVLCEDDPSEENTPQSSLQSIILHRCLAFEQ